MYHIKVSGLTDVGMVRDNNEDAYYIGDSLFIVADGMGGAAAGEVASGIAIKTISSELENYSFSTDDETVQKLKSAVNEADKEIKAQIRQDSSLDGMGTTIVVALNFDTRLLIGYVGDSRAYIIKRSSSGFQQDILDASMSNASAETGVFQPVSDTEKDESDKSITRITQDHSVVMEMVNKGLILEEEIRWVS